MEPKNPQRFIRLVAALRDSGWFDIQTCMIGSGDLMHECRELVEALQLQENIEIKGFRKTHIHTSKMQSFCALHPGGRDLDWWQ